jgi:hypothetical protein
VEYNIRRVPPAPGYSPLVSPNPSSQPMAVMETLSFGVVGKLGQVDNIWRGQVFLEGGKF